MTISRAAGVINATRVACVAHIRLRAVERWCGSGVTASTISASVFPPVPASAGLPSINSIEGCRAAASSRTPRNTGGTSRSRTRTGFDTPAQLFERTPAAAMDRWIRFRRMGGGSAGWSFGSSSSGLRRESQIPSSKSQAPTTPKCQIPTQTPKPKLGSGLDVGIWEWFGCWDLGVAGIWSLGFGI